MYTYEILLHLKCIQKYNWYHKIMHVVFKNFYMQILTYYNINSA
jgi:hypothetical protein